MGARESCGQGMCGCCTVLVDGTAVSGCLYLAAFIDGAQVATVESLADGDKLSPVQEAFIEAGAFQCGYCTPGFLLMATQLLDENPDPDEDAIRHYLSGNLCRCAAYPEIIEAVKIAARKRQAAVSRGVSTAMLPETEGRHGLRGHGSLRTWIAGQALVKSGNERHLKNAHGP